MGLDVEDSLSAASERWEGGGFIRTDGSDFASHTASLEHSN